MHKFSVSELQKVQAYERKLVELLLNCNKQLEEAKLYHRWQVQNEEVAAEEQREQEDSEMFMRR